MMLAVARLQEGKVEVWASASPEQATEGSQRQPQYSPEDVQLGHGTFPMQDLLTKTQARFHLITQYSSSLCQARSCY